MLCPNCKGAKGDIVFWGKRKTRKRGDIQRYCCNECKKCFVFKDPYRFMLYGESEACGVLTKVSEKSHVL